MTVTMKQINSTRILLVEDDQRIVGFIRKGLLEAGYEVSVAEEGPEGLRLASKANHDLIILDLMLPGMDGMEILQRLRDQAIQTPVLILSAKRTVSDKVEGLRAGGDDYLVKPFAFAELLARMESLLRRSHGGNEPVILKVLDLTIDLLSRSVSREGEEIKLQPQEFSLLEYLARNSGRVITRSEILQKVWGYNFDPSTKLVEVHISNLREKIERPGKPKILKTIRGAGYILVDNEETSN
jgi:two-component system OmpR family response regulator